MSDLATSEPMAGNVFHGDVSTGEGGTVNAVGGDQHYGDNYYLSVSALKRRIRYAADPARLDRELRLVVPPPGQDRDLASLREHRILVLAGGAGTGLSTAARHRWRAFAAENPARRAEELFASGEQELVDDLADMKQASVLLLDVSHDRDFALLLIEKAAQLRAALDEQDSFLVLAVGDAVRTAAERALPGSVHRIDRPDPVEVLAKRMQDDSRLQHLARDPGFASLIARLWPPQAVRIAELLRKAPPKSSAADLFTMVRSGLHSWSDELRVLFEQRLTGGASRSLALAASALEGVDRDAIYFAAAALADIAGEQADPSVLSHPGLNQSFAELESVLVAGSGRFAKHGYGEALLPFAWKEFPTWRDPIRAWLDRLLRSQRLGDDTLAVLLPRLLGFAAATGAADLVTARAAVIAGDGSGTRLRRELAAGLLVAGAIDPAVGQQVRSRLWHWSYHRSGVPVALQRTVAQACGDPVYAGRFPRNALTRIKHLLKSEVPAVAESAAAAVVSAAAGMPVQTAVEHLAEWASEARDPQLRAAVPSLLPGLLADTEVRGRWSGEWLARDPSGVVASMWRGVFTNGGPAPVREAVAGWLAFAAAAKPEHRAPLADLLVAAAAGDFWTLGQLSQSLNARTMSGQPLESGAKVLRDRVADSLAQAKVSK